MYLQQYRPACTEKTKSILSQMTEDGELDPAISKFILEEFDDIVAEQQYLYKILCVDFSQVLARYSDYLFNDASILADSAISEKPESSDEIEDLADLEEL